MEPWHVSNNTLLGSPKRGWALTWSLKQLISSQPVINTNTAPGRSFRHIWHKTASIRLNPIQSGDQQDSESRALELYFSKLDLFRDSWERGVRIFQDRTMCSKALHLITLIIKESSQKQRKEKHFIKFTVHFPGNGSNISRVQFRMPNQKRKQYMSKYLPCLWV